MDSISRHRKQYAQLSTGLHRSYLGASGLSLACLCSGALRQYIWLAEIGLDAGAHSAKLLRTCRTNILNLAFSPLPPMLSRAVSTSFSSSLTAYSSVVLVSSTSSTIKMFFPTRLDISREERSSHCVRVTIVPASSTGPSLPKFS